ncbi:L,D-transpeptidase [Patescibacteria group bacterium]
MKPVRFGILLTALAVLFYTGVSFFLPRYYPNQHTPSPDTLHGGYDEEVEIGEYHGTSVLSQRTEDNDIPTDVLGNTSDNKRIEVDLTNQRLYAYEGDNRVYDFIIATGLYDWTPRGNFRIWIKLRYSHMAGGSRAFGTYYNLPNVPYVMYFYNNYIPKTRGFGLHGTYWHNSFGQPRSHGCINLRTQDAEKLYYWATPHLNGQTSIHASNENPGTLITIYGKYQY